MSAPRIRGERFVIDADGNRVAVVLPIAVYEELLERVEQQDDLDALAEGEGDADERVDASTFFDELERERGWRSA
ncbi:MAG: hypothetical protein U5Q44_15885 [Dehalococcoidia bacterium]|nr:hypothetical protein [Dehalococcoidia bacterium]